jgi:hypothetical protein
MRRIVSGLGLTFRYWMQTEVHVYAFSVAANVLLSFFPFLIVMLSLSRRIFGEQEAVGISTALQDYFPMPSVNFWNAICRKPARWNSSLLLLFYPNVRAIRGCPEFGRSQASHLLSSDRQFGQSLFAAGAQLHDDD